MEKLKIPKSIFLLINILILNAFTVVAQQDYLAYSSSVKTSIFTDNFDNNTNQWITDNLWIKGAISNGYYVITCKNYQMSTGLSSKSVPVNPNADFGIETEFKVVKGVGALVFGMTDKYDHYRVEITDNNALTILKDTPSKRRVDKLYTGTGSLPISRELNKVTVVRIQGIFYIYVNESFVTQLNNVKLEGSQIGFNVGTESEISVDYVKVSELQTKPAPALAQNTQTQQSAPAAAAKPVITWVNPARENTSLKTGYSTVRATVRSTTGLQGVKLYLNGIAYSPPDMTPSTTESGVYIIEKTVTFDAGENNIYLEAINDGGAATSEKRYFTIPGSPAPVTAAATQAAPAAPGSPVVTWTSPSGERTTLDTYNATVKASVKSSSGLKSVLLYVNGISKGETDIKLVPNESGTFQIEKNLNFSPGENQIYLVATNAEGATKSEIRYFTNPMAVAPVISWITPSTPNVIVGTESMSVTACIKSPSDLRSVRLLVNGSIFSEDNVFTPSTSGDCNYTWTGSPVLRTGDNSIFIIATNTAGSTTSERRTIKFEAALAEKRIALVFGNSEYKTGAPLKNPVNDANLMEGTLKELGFEVIKRLNVNKAQMEAAIREFTEKLPNYNVALFYYAGHGNQVDGRNYLIPVDANLQKPSDCQWEAINVDLIVAQFEKFQDNTNIVILDACRNNPYTAWARGGDAGFRAMNFSSGTIIGFATSEGATAADGKGANGLYTEELVKQMATPQSIMNVFMNTRSQVRKLSNGAQTPTEWNKLNGDFFFKK